MCRPDMLEACFGAVSQVDVLSPNHWELLSLFGRAHEAFNQETLQDLAKRFVQKGVGPTGQEVMLVRARGARLPYLSHWPGSSLATTFLRARRRKSCFEKQDR